MNAADLAALMDPADGMTVAMTLSGGETFYGHFDDAYVNALDVSTNAPAATCLTSDVSGAAIGSTLVVDGTSYRVTVIEPDGRGITVLRLRLP